MVCKLLYNPVHSYRYYTSHEHVTYNEDLYVLWICVSSENLSTAAKMEIGYFSLIWKFQFQKFLGKTPQGNLCYYTNTAGKSCLLFNMDNGTATLKIHKHYSKTFACLHRWLPVGVEIQVELEQKQDLRHITPTTLALLRGITGHGAILDCFNNF